MNTDTCEINHPPIDFSGPEGSYYPTGCPMCERQAIIEELRAQLATERDKALEEAAKIADDEGCSDNKDCANRVMNREHYPWCPKSIAAAIRSRISAKNQPRRP